VVVEVPPAAPVVAQAAPAPSAAAAPAAVEAPAVPDGPAVKNEVIIEALDQVQVKIEMGGESKTVSLAPNEVYTVRSTGLVALDVSDGGAVSLVHNGRIQGVPGKLGEPKQVKIP
jgi:hypothetical protein